ncbi:LysR family transcriptional regulator [Paraburkholderia caballeronis]|uniref:DNA-binding transcriptional regulator, LysR family n=1 Tax=Paraburkholderia caballeronis TaxID=416943 RepID=A0A1H7P6Z5_9BURK|nr:LysR family transcriptional regulator [Paraburkholderia caballeronis]PXW25367.1 LysR family transcriptional regulator [Paraburkholderia caballeronis]PXX00974.1 LysR family transcriptional regulator [Paraburkholderia caballeronis]RAJ99673.1 LysR family transcriptional regulator [Paraburkholderia caballeronis]SEE40252.1 transcriptional regulator, LysR family [Paraburkholderia caballeronis]SEL31178.1 DNA-binding transcriptional regulator, LysR family [Paraburkholderia caballeronis]
MIRFDDLALFARTAALGSFSNAAREAGLLPGQVSAAIQRLERELDIRLFARSTRSLRLTAEGEQYLPYAEEVLSTLKEGRERLHGERHALQGTLKIAAPSDLGRNVLLPWITGFREAHPKLVLKLFLSDHVADVFRDPVDIAIRYGVAGNASYVELPLAANNRRVLVASPRYLEQHGRPATLDELVMHQCLPFFLGGRVYDRWAFPASGVRRTVTVKGALLCDDADIARRWAVDGRGIAYKSWIDVCDDVVAGRLEVLLPDQPGEVAPLNLVCPHRRQFSPAVRYLHAALRERILAMTAAMREHAAFQDA